MPVSLPDPRQQAAAETALINQDRHVALTVPIDRVIADSPFLDRELLLEGLEEFHRDRMSRIPSTAKYPESPKWVEHVLAVDRELRDLANLSDRDMAVFRSLHEYLAFRGFRIAARRAAADERCRACYVPDTDRGALHMKNVDDPITHWRPEREPIRSFLPDGLRTDGVGNGLHIDEEPDDLFPLPMMNMLHRHATDVPSGVEFLTRYCPFWGRVNLLLHDEKKRSAAVEKCGFKYIDVFYPGPDGRTHISGMTCRDPSTAQGQHQRRMRQEYLKRFAMPDDGPDNAFWSTCAKLDTKLVEVLRALGPKPRSADVVGLFTTQWPQGLNKAGLRIHPDQGLVSYTLKTHAYFVDERKSLRWQRSQDGETFSSEPEVFQF